MNFIRNAWKWPAAVGFCSALLSFSAYAEDSEQNLPDHVAVRSVVHAGTGCPAGSLDTSSPRGASEFLLVWESFSAHAGPNVPLRDARKNCQVNLDIDYTNGWQYAVESIQYSGHVRLTEGTEALAGAAYYFQGSTETSRFNTVFEGPINRRFRIIDAADDADLVWSTCDASRSLNINFQVRMNHVASSGDAEGSVSFGVRDTAGTLVRLKWRRCIEQVGMEQVGSDLQDALR